MMTMSDNSCFTLPQVDHMGVPLPVSEVTTPDYHFGSLTELVTSVENGE